MINAKKKTKLFSRGAGYTLIVAFCLMSVIPFLVFCYVLFGSFAGHYPMSRSLVLLILCALLVSISGFILMGKMVLSVVKMAMAAKAIVHGDYENRLPVSDDDDVDVKEIEQSMNSIASQMKMNVEELKSFSVKTKELNLEIHKRMLVLTGLLQVSDLILNTTIGFQDVIEVAVSKVAGIDETGFAALYMVKDEPGHYVAAASSNLPDPALEALEIVDGQGALGKALFVRTVLIIDSSTVGSREVEEFKRVYRLKNVVALPLFSGKMTLGLLLFGNMRDNYHFLADEIDIIKVFTRQISLAIENHALLIKTQELSTKDELTGLYNKNYIIPRLEEELKRAKFYQRPCSFLTMNIDAYRAFRDRYGESAAEEILKGIAKILKKYVGEFGRAARIAGDEFALLLPEKNKREAFEIAEEIRSAVGLSSFMKSQREPVTISIGVSENPIDGMTADDIYKRSLEALSKAKIEGRNRVVG